MIFAHTIEITVYGDEQFAKAQFVIELPCILAAGTHIGEAQLISATQVYLTGIQGDRANVFVNTRMIEYEARQQKTWPTLQSFCAHLSKLLKGFGKIEFVMQSKIG